MKSFCTIASGNYLPFVETLFSTLQSVESNFVLHVLMTDKNYTAPQKECLRFYHPQELNGDLVSDVLHQYAHRNDYLRWAMKPVFLSHLLKENESVIYVDNDIAFFSSPNFLFEELQHHSILLTPHWFCLHPYPHPENFDTNFQIGLFNAGFIGASRKGMPFLKWWAEACLYRMERAEADGFYDDQRYLDMAPLIDQNMGIVRHLGCNLGSWNIHQNKRTNRNGDVLINGEFPIVFIHFNHETIKHILNGNDALLRPHFDAYEKIFATTGHKFQDFITRLPEWEKATPLQHFARKTLLRTRLKRWLFNLSRKL